VLFSLTALLVVTIDQLSKWWIRSNLAIGDSLFDLRFFRITRIYNTGAAFGLFRDHSVLLAIIAIIGILTVLIVVLVINRSSPFLNNTLSKLSLGLLLGGASGNLIDRLRLGSVTDFIDFRIWPAFNAADAAISVGVILLVYSLIFLTRNSGTSSDSSISADK